MRKLLGIELPEEEFNFLMNEQTKGKELKLIDGKIIAIDHIVTEEELKINRKQEISHRLTELSYDFIQSLAGADLPDLDLRMKEFQSLHNELREIKNKPKRHYN